MNVGIIISHTLDQMEEKFSQAATQGFHYCQITSWDPSLWTEENAAEIRGLCGKYEMEITAFWCGWAGPRAWNFTEGPETLGIVPVAFRAGQPHHGDTARTGRRSQRHDGGFHLHSPILKTA